MIVDLEQAKREKIVKELQDKQISLHERQAELQEKTLKILGSKRYVTITRIDGKILTYDADLVNADGGLYVVYIGKENKIVKIPIDLISEIEEILQV